MNVIVAFKQFIPEMTHRTEKEHDPLLVTPHVRVLLVDFRHPDSIGLFVEVVKDS